MAEDKFIIVADLKQILLRIALFGHWDVAEVLKYKHALANVIRRTRAGG